MSVPGGLTHDEVQVLTAWRTLRVVVKQHDRYKGYPGDELTEALNTFQQEIDSIVEGVQEENR